MAHRHLHHALDHPDLLVDVASGALIRHALAGGEDDVHELDGRTRGRRQIAADIAGGRVGPRGLLGGAGHGRRLGGGRRILLEERRERDAQAGGELVEHGGRGAALAALDERDVGAAHAAALGQRVEREASGVAQLADTPGDAGGDVHAV